MAEHFSTKKALRLNTYIVLHLQSTILVMEQTHLPFQDYSIRMLQSCVDLQKERKRDAVQQPTYRGRASLSIPSTFLFRVEICRQRRVAVDRHRDIQEFVTRHSSIGPCELPEIVDPLARMHK